MNPVLNPLQKALVYSGVDRSQIKGSSRSKTNSVKISDLLENQNKNNLENIQFDGSEFPLLISRNIKKLKTNYSESITLVANKLKDDAELRKGREGTYGSIHKFFHKVAQALQGHGYRFESEWEKDVAKQLLDGKEVQEGAVTAVQKELVTKFPGLKEKFDQASSISAPPFDSSQILAIQNCSISEFQEVVNYYLEAPMPEGGVKNIYRQLYFALDEKKHKLLINSILNRHDWSEQLIKMGVAELQVASWEGMDPSDDLLEKMVSKAVSLFNIAMDFNRNKAQVKAAKVLLQKIAMKCLDMKNETEGMGKFDKLTQQMDLKYLQCLLDDTLLSQKHHQKIFEMQAQKNRNNLF